MEDLTYSMADIEKFLVDYRQSQRTVLKSWLLGVPIVGEKLYEKALFEESKINIFERAYNRTLTGSIEEQTKFIMEMTPVLDDYYGKEKNKGMKR